MTIRLSSLVCALLLIGSPPSSSAQSTEDVLGFARSLLTEGEYYRAITEYKRALFLAPAESTAVRELAILGIGGALHSGAEYFRSAEWLQAHLMDLRTGESRSEGLRLIYRSLLACGAGDRLLEVTRATGDSTPDAELYQGLAHARMGRWAEARAVFQELSADERYGSMAAAYTLLAREGEQAKRKSPGLATVLGIVPGLGYWYAGHRQTAIASLLVNGIFVGGTIQAFRADQDILGGFLCLLTASWYGGNIYGSAGAARRYNDELQDELWLQFVY